MCHRAAQFSLPSPLRKMLTCGYTVHVAPISHRAHGSVPNQRSNCKEKIMGITLADAEASWESADASS
jgi:hypothetical protein